MPMLPFVLSGRCIHVAGHKGLLASAIVGRLAGENYEILVAERGALELTSQQATEKSLERMRPDAVFLAAGPAGSIHANSAYPADFIANNLAIAVNVIRGAHAIGVNKLLAIGSSCIYPKFVAQPMSEDMLLTGPLKGQQTKNARLGF